MSLSLANEVFRGLAFYGGLSLVKVLAMGPLTGLYRKSSKSFANPEDAKGVGGAKDADEVKVQLTPNDDVERVSDFQVSTRN